MALSVEKFAHPPLHEVYPPLHVKPQVLPLHVGEALATAVVHAFEHAPQLLRFVAVFTHAPPHCAGAEAGQTHVELWQTVPPPHANEEPQPPQLLLSLVKFTHAPLQLV